MLYAYGITNYENNEKQGKIWMWWIVYSITSSIIIGVFTFDSQIFIVMCSFFLYVVRLSL